MTQPVPLMREILWIYDFIAKIISNFLLPETCHFSPPQAERNLKRVIIDVPPEPVLKNEVSA